MPSVWLILISCQMISFFQFRITGYHWIKPGKGIIGDIVLCYLAGYFLTSRSLRQSALVYLKCISSYFLYWSASQQANWRFHGFKTYEINSSFSLLSILFCRADASVSSSSATSRNTLTSLPLFIFSQKFYKGALSACVYVCAWLFSLVK